MKSFYSYLILILFVISSPFAQAQIDLQCNGRDMHSIYFITNAGDIYRSDSVDTSPTDAIPLDSVTPGSVGISINNNLNIPGSGESVYIIGTSTYNYWNGTAWINTNHTSGSLPAVNPGGSFDYIFNLNAQDGAVYRYDGTGNGTLLVSGLPSSNNSVYDVATDNFGNFYIFYTIDHIIIMYTPSGIPVDTFNTTGFSYSVSNGLAIIGDKIYASHPHYLYEGIKNGSTINFSLIKYYNEQFSDAAACPGAGTPLSVFSDPEAPHFITFPNPASEMITMKIHNTITIDVFDCLGRHISNIDVRGESEHKLNVSALKSGVYFVKATSEKGSTASKTILVGGR